MRGVVGIADFEHDELPSPRSGAAIKSLPASRKSANKQMLGQPQLSSARDRTFQLKLAALVSESGGGNAGWEQQYSSGLTKHAIRHVLRSTCVFSTGPADAAMCLVSRAIFKGSLWVAIIDHSHSFECSWAWPLVVEGCAATSRVGGVRLRPVSPRHADSTAHPASRTRIHHWSSISRVAPL